MPAARAAQAEIHAAAQHQPLLCAAGVLFFHDEDIVDLYVHGVSPFLPLPAYIGAGIGGDLMNHMLPEGLHPQPEGYTREELLLAMQQRRVLQARAVLCDERHALHVPLGCCEGVIERAEGARGIAGGQTRDLAILSCVGRPVCFHVLGFFPDGRARLSRRSAQEQALDLLLRQRPGEILPAVVTGLAEFGAFCDIGCGIAALLPIDCLSVSRIASPADRVQVGQQLLCAIKNRDAQGRIVLTLRELLGTWSENAACFAAGELDFLTLEVRPSNAAALALYRELGFQPVGRRRDFYTDPTEDALLLTKTFKKEEPDG